jgi:hypothetical protein
MLLVVVVITTGECETRRSLSLSLSACRRVNYLNIVVVDTLGRCESCSLVDIFQTIERQRNANLSETNCEQVCRREQLTI